MTKEEFQHLSDLVHKVAEEIAERKMNELKGFVFQKVQEELNDIVRGEVRNILRSALEEKVSVQLNVRVP